VFTSWHLRSRNRERERESKDGAKEKINPSRISP
jgi:hypothetical protein